jgi:hypothetical protein
MYIFMIESFSLEKENQTMISKEEVLNFIKAKMKIYLLKFIQKVQ